ADEAIAGLVVRHVPAERRGQGQTTERVRETPDRWHLAERALADDELGSAFAEHVEERGDLIRIVLAVSVERDGRWITEVERVPEPGAQGGPLAGIRKLVDHRRAGSLRPSGCVVGRSVVDDH